MVITRTTKVNMDVGARNPGAKENQSGSVKRTVTMLRGWRLLGSEPGQGSGSVGG